MILRIIALIHLSLFLEYVQSALLVERPNGFFITGRGCGTTTALKYLNYLPKKLEEHQCSFINLNSMIPVKGKIQNFENLWSQLGIYFFDGRSLSR